MDWLYVVIKSNRQLIDYLEEVMMWTLRPPNIDKATITGMTQDTTPSTLSANVWWRKITIINND
jgi:hypothetical protein